MSRFRMLLLSATLLLSSTVLSGAAWAGPVWCEEDPEFIVNGAAVDVTTFIPASYASTITGSVNFDLQVPSNVVAAAVSLPGYVPVTATVSRTLAPYSGIGQIPVVVTVTMNTSERFDTYTQITGMGGTLVNWQWGSSKDPTKAKFYMYGL